MTTTDSLDHCVRREAPGVRVTPWHVELPTWRTRYLALVALSAAALQPGPAAADTAKPLVLPLAAAVALGRTAVAYGMAAAGPSHAARAGSGLLTLLPSQLDIPDGYEVDNGPRVPLSAAPVDSDRLVGVDLNGRRWHGWKASLNLYEETPHPVGSSGTLLSVRFQYRF